jgi:hypothetical protein
MFASLQRTQEPPVPLSTADITQRIIAVEFAISSDPTRARKQIMMFFLPPIASVVLFAFMWHEDLLSWPYVVGGCVLVGVAGQLVAPVYSGVWFAAALLNVGVAIYLAIRLKLSV